MATIYPVWNEQYGIGLQATWNTDYTNFTNAVAVGGGSIPANGTKQLDILGYPNIEPGVNIINSKKALGVPWNRVEENYLGLMDATITFDLDMSVNNIALFLWSLFCGIDEGGTTPFTKVYNIYRNIAGNAPSHPDFNGKSGSALTTPALFSLIRNTGVAGECHRLSNGAVRSITISGEAGGTIKASIEMVGVLQTNYDGGDTFTLSTVNNTALLTQDFVLAIGGTATRVNSFSITMTNNLIMKHQANGSAQRPTDYLVGAFDVSGNFSIPWGTNENENSEIEKLTVGDGSGRPDDSLLEFYTPSTNSGGGSTTAGDFYLQTNVIYTAVPLEGDDELTTNITIQGVADADNPVAKITLADAIDYGLPT